MNGFGLICANNGFAVQSFTNAIQLYFVELGAEIRASYIVKPLVMGHFLTEFLAYWAAFNKLTFLKLEFS